MLCPPTETEPRGRGARGGAVGFVLRRLRWSRVARVAWPGRVHPPAALTLVDRKRQRMNRALIIVSRDRPNLFQQLSERQTAEVQVLLDRRRTPRALERTARPPSGAWHTTLERDGYIVVPATVTGAPDRDTVTTT